MRKSCVFVVAASALLAVAAPPPSQAAVNICWELAEPLWVPPTPLDAAECLEKNWPVCFFMPHCCGPTCRLHPECVLGGTFVRGHWDTLECRMMEPEVALEQFLRGHLRPADDFLEPIRQAAVLQINGLMAFGQRIPPHVQTLLNTLMRSRLLAGQPQFRPGDVARALLLPERQPTADLYLSNATTRAITLDSLIILRNGLFDSIFREPPRTADDFFCGRVSPAFANAIRILMHELVHVRQWDVLGRDSFLNNYLIEVMLAGYGSDAFESEAFRLDNFVNAQLVAPERSEAHGWIFSDLATFTGARRPASGSVNSAGGANTVSRTGTGVYAVSFAGLSAAAGGNVQVTAGTANRSCKPAASSSSGPNLAVGVRCFDNAGRPADSPFFATVQQLTRMCQGTSYLRTGAITGTFVPGALTSHSQSLEPNTVTRTASGRYTATLRGVPGIGGHPQVSAFGTQAERCQIVSWGIRRGTATVDVACFAAAASPVDTRFSLQFGNQDVVGRVADAIENAGAYLWSHQLTPSAPYTPAEAWRYSHREDVLVFEAPTVERLSAGRYRTLLPGYAAEVGQAALQLSPTGSSDRICSILGRSASGTRAQVDVACTSASGAPTDSRWMLMFGSNAPIPF